MKKFNKMTEKQMSKTDGGILLAGIAIAATLGLTAAVAIPFGVSKTK